MTSFKANNSGVVNNLKIFVNLEAQQSLLMVRRLTCRMDLSKLAMRPLVLGLEAWLVVGDGAPRPSAAASEKHTKFTVTTNSLTTLCLSVKPQIVLSTTVGSSNYFRSETL